MDPVLPRSLLSWTYEDLSLSCLCHSIYRWTAPWLLTGWFRCLLVKCHGVVISLCGHAQVAGTEQGVTEPEATFSACFGGAFLMWHPMKVRLLAPHCLNCPVILSGPCKGARHHACDYSSKRLHSPRASEFMLDQRKLFKHKVLRMRAWKLTQPAALCAVRVDAGGEDEDARRDRVARQHRLDGGALWRWVRLLTASHSMSHMKPT